MKTFNIDTVKPRTKPTRVVTAAFLSFVVSHSISHGEVIEANSDGVIVMEAEETSSSLGSWKEKTDIKGYSGESYLEFTGNTPANGPAKSPLKYEFKIPKDGLYYIHLFCAKEAVKLKGELRTDVANDCYIKVTGDYEEGPNAGKNSGDQATYSDLKQNNKFFGGGDKEFKWASGEKLDLGGHKNKRIAVYQFKAGKTYKLTISGRSQKFKLDKIMFSTSARALTKGPKGGKKGRKR